MHEQLDAIIDKIISAHEGVKSQESGSPHVRRDMDRALNMYKAELAAAKLEAHNLLDRVAAGGKVKGQDVCEDSLSPNLSMSNSFIENMKVLGDLETRAKFGGQWIILSRGKIVYHTHSAADCADYASKNALSNSLRAFVEPLKTTQGGV